MEIETEKSKALVFEIEEVHDSNELWKKVKRFTKMEINLSSKLSLIEIELPLSQKCYFLI